MARATSGRDAAVFVRMPAALSKRIRRIAKDDERSISGVVRRLLLKALSR